MQCFPKTILAFLGLVMACAVSGESPPTPEQLKFFENQVRPLLVENCFKCHGEKKQKASLRLDSMPDILKGGESGPALVRGKPEISLLVQAVTYTDDSLQMPPFDKLTKTGGKLSDRDIQTLTEWVRMGAPWPEGKSLAGAHKQRIITAQDRQFWSFQPVKNTVPPPGDAWCRNEIDDFIAAKLKAENLTPAEPAERATLIRRVTFDLHGLPPTPQEIEAFVRDPAPDAYEKLVDRLLASPRYGEHYARDWLDLVRFAESDGFKQDAFRPNAWPYRDYVIKAFNADKPYDRFVTEQLAGDEIAPEDPDVLVATSYLRLGMYEYNQRDVPKQWSEYLNDITDVTGDVFMGMSMGCARCHDHKFDPILQADYFRMQAVFSALLPRDDLVLAPMEQKKKHDAAQKVWEEKTAAVRAQIADIEKPQIEKARKTAIDKFLPEIAATLTKNRSERTPYEEQIAALAYRQVQFEEEQVDGKLKGPERDKWTASKRTLGEFDELKPKPLPLAFVATDVGAQGPPAIIPGDREKRTFEPGLLTVLGAEPLKIEALANSTGRRSAFARWLTRPDNPLTARVIVNRVWQHHFGRGLVATPSDFGKLGELPSHPELLDWMAHWFVENGWSQKKLHRLILTSATYRQSAMRPAPEIAKLKDPDNRWLWRMNSRRLNAEEIRDAMLAISGELQDAANGPSADANSTRRSVYTRVLRNTPDPVIAAFDGVDGINSIPKRNNTTTAPQALLLLNGQWALKRATALASKLEQSKLSGERLVDGAYRSVFGRAATPEETDRALAFLNRHAADSRAASSAQKAATAPMPLRGTQALVIHKGDAGEFLKLPDTSKLPAGDFTLEAIVLLESIFDNANVRTIVAQWDGDQKNPGWALGVTSEKSKHEPRNLILQLSGDAGYEAIPSDLRLDLHRTYYVGVAVKIQDTQTAGVTFYVKDLSDPDTPLRTAAVTHKNTGGFHTTAPLTIGGRPEHGWDGLIDEIRISNAALAKEKLLVNEGDPQPDIVAYWRFEEDPGLLRDSSKHQGDLVPALPEKKKQPASAALIDFCDVLFNANEFLYVE